MYCWTAIVNSIDEHTVGRDFVDDIVAHSGGPNRVGNIQSI